MPTKPQTPVYVGGDDPALIEKRRSYEEALERLNRSLDARQKRFFDPAMLGAAQELLSPGKTGSFFEAIGRAAGAYGRGQEGLIKEEQDIARAQLESTQTGLELERQKQADASLESYLQGKKSPAEQPMGGLAIAQAPAGPLADIGQYGIKISPANPDRMTGEEFIRLNRGRMAPQDLMREAQKIEKENIKVTEAGVFNEATGMFYPSPKGELVERQIYGYGPKGEAQTVKVPQATAFMLDQYAAAKDPRYYDLVEQIRSGPPRKTVQFAGQPEVPAPSAALPSKSEMDAAAEAGKELEVGRVKAALKSEEALPGKTEAAQRAFAAAADTERIVKKNPTAFGRLKQQGLVPGILNLVSQGVQTPGGSINVKQLDEFVVQTTGKEGDLVDRQLAARNMAELILAFRRQYFSGYGGGAISDMEQAIVNQLSARLEDDPRTIVGIMNLIKKRSQYDIDESRKWLEFKRENKKANYSDFTESPDYLARQDKYNRAIGKMFGTEPAVPSEQKGTSQFTPEQINAARQRLLGRGAR